MQEKSILTHQGIFKDSCGVRASPKFKYSARRLKNMIFLKSIPFKPIFKLLSFMYQQFKYYLLLFCTHNFLSFFCLIHHSQAYSFTPFIFYIYYIIWFLKSQYLFFFFFFSLAFGFCGRGRVILGPCL